MKKFKISIPMIAAILLAAFGGAYIGSPYISTSSFLSAMSNYDADKASEYVDYAAVRENLKQQANAEMAMMIEEDDGNEGMGMLGAAIATPMVNMLLDAYVTPAGLDKMLTKASREKKGDTGDRAYSTEYDGLDRFLVHLQKDQGDKAADTITIAFERRGLFSWKIVSLDLPFNELRDELKGNKSASSDPYGEMGPPYETEAQEMAADIDNEDNNEDVIVEDHSVRVNVTEKTPAKRETATPKADDPVLYEQPGFFYEVDKNGNPTNVDANGNPIPIKQPK